VSGFVAVTRWAIYSYTSDPDSVTPTPTTPRNLRGLGTESPSISRPPLKVCATECDHALDRAHDRINLNAAHRPHGRKASNPEGHSVAQNPNLSGMYDAMSR
jgi:hypothetical protein